MSYDLRFERVIDAPLHDVFDAFTDSDGQVAFWTGRPGMGREVRLRSARRRHLDRGVRTLARSPVPSQARLPAHRSPEARRPRTTETRPDGTSFDINLEFTFKEQDGKTLMVMEQRGFPTRELRVGLSNAFTRLERAVRA